MNTYSLRITSLICIILVIYNSMFAFNKQESFDKKIKLIKANKLQITACEKLRHQICNIVDKIRQEGLENLEKDTKVVKCGQELATETYIKIMKDDIKLIFHPNHKSAILHNKIVEMVLTTFAEYTLEEKVKSIILGAVYLDVFIACEKKPQQSITSCL